MPSSNYRLLCLIYYSLCFVFIVTSLFICELTNDNKNQTKGVYY
jgi:hypothetical protein